MTSTKLKIIACVTMLIDHLTTFFDRHSNFELVATMNSIGRLAFPIFAFLIAEGFYHTKNAKKYLTRLLIFAVISQIPYNITFMHKWIQWDQLNILFNFFFGLLALVIYKKNKYAGVAAVIAFSFLNQYVIHMGYGAFGVLLVFFFYIFRGSVVKQGASLTIMMVIYVLRYVIKFYPRSSFYMYLQLFAILSIVFIAFYNGKKGKDIKYLFYVFYPGHIAAIGILDWLIRYKL